MQDNNRKRGRDGEGPDERPKRFKTSEIQPSPNAPRPTQPPPRSRQPIQGDSSRGRGRGRGGLPNFLGHPNPVTQPQQIVYQTYQASASGNTQQPAQYGPPYPLDPRLAAPGFEIGMPQYQFSGNIQPLPQAHVQGRDPRWPLNPEAQPFNTFREIRSTQTPTSGIGIPDIAQGGGRGQWRVQQIPPYQNNPHPQRAAPSAYQGTPLIPEPGRTPQVSQPVGIPATAPPRPRIYEMLAWPEKLRNRPELEDTPTPRSLGHMKKGFATIKPLDSQGRAHYRGIGTRRESIPREFIVQSPNVVKRLRNPEAFTKNPVETDVDPLTKFDRKQWLQSDWEWYEGLAGPQKGLAGPNPFHQYRWRGTKYLGQGGNGIIGLWTREPGGEDNPPESKLDGSVHQVVVKQQQFNESFFLEASMSNLLRKTNSRHLVKVYKTAMKSEKGYDVSTAEKHSYMPPQKNPGFQVHVGRMFMEFCDGGTLDDFLTKEIYINHTAKDPFPERLVWNIFGCLALGLVAIENGDEDPEKAGITWNQAHNLIHFDIKGDNIFAKLDVSGHRETPLFKIADFGCMQDAPNRDAQARDSTWARNMSWLTRFKGSHAAPEQAHRKYTVERYYGAQTNTWQIGRLMATILLRGRDIYKAVGRRPYFQLQPNANGPQVIRTIGTDILDAPYSVTLRRLVLQCLAYDWRDRPRSVALWKEINDACEAAGEIEAEQARTDVDRQMFEEIQNVNREMYHGGGGGGVAHGNGGQSQMPQQPGYQERYVPPQRRAPVVERPPAAEWAQMQPPVDDYPLFTDINSFYMQQPWQTYTRATDVVPHEPPPYGLPPYGSPPYGPPSN